LSRQLIQGDDSADNVKFPDGSRYSSAALATRHVKCYSYHARTSVTVSGGGSNFTVKVIRHTNINDYSYHQVAVY